jgi:uncharacterized membrane protein
MFCPSCGAQVAPDLRFCPTCGASQPAATTSGQPQPEAIPGASPQQIGANPILPPPPAPFAPPSAVYVTTGKWISESWTVVTGDLAMFAVMALVYFACNSVIPLVLHGPLMAGFYIACIRKLKRGAPIDIGDLFKGFNVFVPALVVAILTSIFIFFGMLLCLIPGLIVAAIYMFPYHFIVDRGMDFWPAMQASHEVVKKNYFGFVMFLIALACINILGACALLVGLLVTIPMTFVAVTAAYRDTVGFNPNSVY